MSDVFINAVRNVVYEVLISLFTPIFVVFTFINVTDNNFVPPDIDVFQSIVFGGLLAFVFPMLRSVITTTCLLINAIVIYIRIQTKCKTVWDCQSTYDLFHQYIPVKF